MVYQRHLWGICHNWVQERLCISIIVGQRHRGQFCKHRNSDIHYLSISLPDWVFLHVLRCRTGSGICTSFHSGVGLTECRTARHRLSRSYSLNIISFLQVFYLKMVGGRWTYGHYFVQADWWWRRETPIQNIGQGIGNQGTLCIHPVQSLQNVEIKNTFLDMVLGF